MEQNHYSLIIDTSSLNEDENLIKRILDKIFDKDVSKNSPAKEFLFNSTCLRNAGNKRYRYIQNLTNDKKSIEIFLKDKPNDKNVDDIKRTLSSIVEITGYRLMIETIKTTSKIEIYSI